MYLQLKLKHMKKLSVLGLTVIAICIIAGCTKSSTTSPTIVGLWKGTQVLDIDVHMLYRSNGTVRVFFDATDTAVISPDKIAEGTYIVSSDSVRLNYKYNDLLGHVYSAAAKMNAAATSMYGTVGEGPSTGGLTTFSLTK